MERVRTPDERFANLPDFDFDPVYTAVGDPTGGDELRVAYLDEGPDDGDVVLLLHLSLIHIFTVLSDACLDADPEVHNVLMTKVFVRQATVLTVEEWTSQLASKS